MSASSNDAQHEASREEDVSGVSAPVTRPGDSASRRPIRPSVSMIRSRRDDETAADGEVALVAELADGDRERALGELQRRYGAPLYGLGMRLLGDRGMAEELVQDTFVRLWRSAGRYDPAQSSVRTFLYTLARVPRSTFIAGRRHGRLPPPPTGMRPLSSRRPRRSMTTRFTQPPWRSTCVTR